MVLTWHITKYYLIGMIFYTTTKMNNEFKFSRIRFDKQDKTEKKREFSLPGSPRRNSLPHFFPWIHISHCQACYEFATDSTL